MEAFPLSPIQHHHHRLCISSAIDRSMPREESRLLCTGTETMYLSRVGAVFLLTLLASSSAFLPSSFQSIPTKRAITSRSSLCVSRRSFFVKTATTSCVVATTTALLFDPPSVLAIPSLTLQEFESILRKSARSVESVEFAGPKSDIVTVRLIDGTSFGISDVIESPTDPRSPLKLAATLRGYKIPTKFMTLESALSTTPKKTKVYYNARVQEAAEKEKEKKERMAQDEEERLEALSKMGQDDGKR